jgi:hypothetical protein
MESNKKYYTDWLGVEKIYYNTSTGKIANNILDVIDFESFEWDYEGLKNYLDFGYSVFEQTPVKNVKFLRHSSEIYHDGRQLIINHGADTTLNLIDAKTEENDTIELIKTKINNWLIQKEGSITVPTSGGYDSRLINNLIKEKHRINAYTYGLSENQQNSFEVVYAQNLCEKLGINWKFIPLGNFHSYIDEWDGLYSVGTHSHGMYHIEFYKNILQNISTPQLFLSGIIGDIWAGSMKIPEITSPQDVVYLSYNHGVCGDKFQLVNNTNSVSKYTELYFENQQQHLKNPRYRIMESMRSKIILLNYLVKIPSYFGFEVYSPFLDQDVALGMLNLSDERRENRQWQIDYFRKNGIYLEDNKLKCSKLNNLNYQAALKKKLTPLSNNLLELFNKNYLDWINKNTLQRKRSRAKESMYLLRKKYYSDTIWPKRSTFDIKAYSAYLTLYPIDQLIKRRNEYFNSIS